MFSAGTPTLLYTNNGPPRVGRVAGPLLDGEKTQSGELEIFVARAPAAPIKGSTAIRNEHAWWMRGMMKAEVSAEAVSVPDIHGISILSLTFQVGRKPASEYFIHGI